MKIFKNRTFVSIMSILIPLTILEVLFRVFNEVEVFSLSFFRSFLFILIIASLFGYINTLLSKKTNKVLNGLLVFIFSLYAWLQLGFLAYIGVYMSFNASGQLDAVTSYIIDFLKAEAPINYIMFVPFIIYIIMLLFYNKVSDKNYIIKLKTKIKGQWLIRLSSVTIVICTSALIAYLSMGVQDDTSIVDIKKLFLTANNPAIAIKEFGVSGFSFVDIKSLVYNPESFDIDTESPVDIDTNRYIDDTYWLKQIGEEKNKTLNNLNKYFISQDISPTNDMTGMFDGKNLIVIMMESVNSIMNNPEYFPNFTKMLNEGWYFPNNFSPRNSCATGNNEFSAMTGLYSIYNTCTSNSYASNKYPESIFGVFNDAGYITNSFHDFTDSYYVRTKIHPNMGSQKYYGVKDLKIKYSSEYGSWASDVDMMNKYLEIIDGYDKEKPFMSYITTVSSHAPYYSTTFGNLYYDMTKGTGINSSIRHYLSKLKILDNAFGVLLEGLSERGLLEDTVIVLFGDHYPYAISTNTLKKYMDDPLQYKDIEKTPLVIYNPSLTGSVNETYTSYVNLVPTIANLFGLDFDPRLYSGYDIFDSNYWNTVVFADGSWKNDKAYYNAATGKITYFIEDFSYTSSEIKDINEIIDNKMSSSTNAIKKNYFNYLFNNVKNVDEESEEVVN